MSPEYILLQEQQGSDLVIIEIKDMARVNLDAARNGHIFRWHRDYLVGQGHVTCSSDREAHLVV